MSSSSSSSSSSSGSSHSSHRHHRHHKRHDKRRNCGGYFRPYCRVLKSSCCDPYCERCPIPTPAPLSYYANRPGFITPTAGGGVINFVSGFVDGGQFWSLPNPWFQDQLNF